jgi:hypothetical protein
MEYAQTPTMNRSPSPCDLSPTSSAKERLTRLCIRILAAPFRVLGVVGIIVPIVVGGVLAVSGVVYLRVLGGILIALGMISPFAAIGPDGAASSRDAAPRTLERSPLERSLLPADKDPVC